MAANTSSEIKIENALYAVHCTPDTGIFQILSKAGNLAFIQEGKWTLAKATASVVSINHPVYGAGKSILLTGQESTASITLFDSSPFVFFGGNSLNTTAQEMIINEYAPHQLSIQINEPVSAIRVLGTAGLKKPEENPGSYTFLAVGSVEHRNGIVAGWLTQDRGNGVIFSERKEDAVLLRPQIDYGRLVIPAKSEAKHETLVVGYFDDVRDGLEKYADHIAAHYAITLPRIPSGYCTWYSNPHGGANDEKHLPELAAFVQKTLKPFGLDFIQIDDQWQGRSRDRGELDRRGRTDDYLGKPKDEQNKKWWWGPHADFTQHDPEGPYPSGMTSAAQNLSTLGFIPGLWLMPFAWDPLCDTLIDHQDYFLKRADGGLYYAKWAGWCLDITNPAAHEFLQKSIQRITKEWGFNYLKLDGLWNGTGANLLYVNDGYVKDDLGEAVAYDRTKTPIERYREGLKLVRLAAGTDVFILGCNVSQNMRTLGGSFGLLDAMRIGPDNGPDMNSLKAGPWHGSNRYFLHGRVWYNDPDPVYLRASMPLEHSLLLCSWVALSGQLTVMSDWLPDLPEERLDIAKRILPNHGLKARPVDLFEHDLPQVWILTDTQSGVRRDVLGFYNWDEKQDTTITYTAEKLGLPDAPRYAAFDFWEKKSLGVFEKELSVSLPKGSCRVIAVRPLLDHPFVLSTNRHITQGIVDITSENWDSAANTLSGSSKIVEGDPYELRIIVPAGWSADTIKSETPDCSAAMTQTDTELRAVLRSPTSAEVRWDITFKRT
ncbi:MAG TPA: hypothetical protein PLI09_20640 [Candidatus Hydrogenedentes bacterium]|nr:hypothetical protein [Candidatus Hydrogenedentota bacterium]